MTKNQVLKGVFLVGLGATSYGMLATFVKMAYDEDYSTPEVTTAQFVLGILTKDNMNADFINHPQETSHAVPPERLQARRSPGPRRV